MSIRSTLYGGSSPPRAAGSRRAGRACRGCRWWPRSGRGCRRAAVPAAAGPGTAYRRGLLVVRGPRAPRGSVVISAARSELDRHRRRCARRSRPPSAPCTPGQPGPCHSASCSAVMSENPAIDLRIGAYRVDVEPVDDALGAVAAAGADHAAHRRVAQRRVEAGEPGVVRSGQVAAAVERARRDHDLQAPGGEHRDAERRPAPGRRRTGRRDEHDGVAGAEHAAANWIAMHRASLPPGPYG